jgi:hypothetical protein
VVIVGHVSNSWLERFERAKYKAKARSMAANNARVADIAADLTNVYESIGKGQSAATKKGKVHALNYFVTFLGTLIPPLKYSELNGTTLTEDTFRQFGTYLADFARDSRGDPLSLGTALQYFSGAKTKALHDFPGLEVFKHQSVHEEWNADIRAALTDIISRRCIANGVPITEKAPQLSK